jgi:hypothetical protein
MDKRKDVAVAAAVMVFGIVLIVFAQLLPAGAIRDPLGPAAMPTGVGVLLIVGGGYLVLRRVLQWRSTPVLVPAEGSEDLERYPASSRRAFTVWGICLAYGILVSYVGFIFLTPILIVALLWTLRFRKVLPVILIALIATALMYGLFDILLLVRLPHGPLTGII